MKERDIPLQFAECRILRHAWTCTTVERQKNVYVQGLRCLRCDTQRFIEIHARTGESLKNYYRYPQGYTLKGGRLTKQEQGELRLYEVKHWKN